MKLGLGTVQFGLDYGISNLSGQTHADEVAKILGIAANSGITVLDTASQYGESEQILGNCLAVIHHHFSFVTKIPGFSDETISEKQCVLLRNAFHQSLRKLKQSSVYGLLMHNADDLLKPGGERLWETLVALKQVGLVSKLGVSVYSANQIDRLLECYALDLVQLPINVFDQRLLVGGQLEALKNAGVEIHARSVFLQGLMLMQADTIPAYFLPIQKQINCYQHTLQKYGMSLLEGALGFIQQVNEIDVVLCGVNNANQLQNIIKVINVNSNAKEIAYETFAINQDAYVNPSLWLTDRTF